MGLSRATDPAIAESSQAATFFRRRRTAMATIASDAGSISDDARWSLEQKLLMRLVDDTIFLNVIDLSIERHGAWVLVGSSTDWLRRGRFQKNAPIDLFSGPVPFYEAGQNSFRSEAVIRALSEKVLVLGPEGHEFLVPYGKGDHEQAVLDAARSMRKVRVVGFLVSIEERSSESVAPG